MNKSAPTPLRKIGLNGKLYVRQAPIIAKISELQLLSKQDLVKSCEIQAREDQAYVPSECLLYFLRACRADNSDENFERLYSILLERILRRLPSGESLDGKSLSLTKSAIREKVLERFVEMLAVDRTTYSEKLDYFEVRFDGAMANLRRDAQEEAWRNENRSKPIEFDGDGEPNPEIFRVIGEFDPFAETDADYRSRLDAAIKSLPIEQRKIIEMMQRDIPIDSIDPKAETISKNLGKSEKTVRTYRLQALAALRSMLERE